MGVSLFDPTQFENPNVKFVFIYSAFQSLGRGIWFGNVFSLYIFILAGYSNSTLGWTSVATGIPMTLVLLPSGYLSDIFRRDYLLRLSAVSGGIGILLLLLANNLIIIMISLVFMGLTHGLTRPALESIFADSVESGNRAGIYSALHITRNVFRSVGPFLNVGLFYILGDQWELSILKTVIFVGLAIYSISIITLFFFNDDHSMDDVSEAFSETEDKDESIVPEVTSKRQFIPMILVASNLIIGLGAGMTIKFFGPFFVETYSLRPSSVNLIFGATSLATGLTTFFTGKFSIEKGRVIMIFVVQFAATLCLVFIAFLPPIFVLVPIFIARGSLMNAAQPLSRSILMDYVPKRNRGKWNSIEALAWGMFWNISAVFGGYLIDWYGYTTTFFITSGVYVVGSSLVLFLIPLVAREKKVSKSDKVKDESKPQSEDPLEEADEDKEETSIILP